MRCVQRENVQEHSLQVAMVSHGLALIKNKLYGGRLNPEKVAVIALFHDATEVLTGDLPTPVKYFSGEIRDAYKAFEGHAAQELLKLLPSEFREDYSPLIVGRSDDQEAHEIIKAADTICAFIKCLEERAAGNQEFSKAQKALEAKLDALAHRPEVGYFMKNFVPSFSLTLDEISKPLEL